MSNSVLETFYLLFESDSKEFAAENKQVEKSTKDVEKSLRDLKGQIDPTFAATSKLSKQMAQLDAEFKAGRITQIEYAKYQKIIQANLRELQSGALKATNGFASLGRSIFGTFAAILSVRTAVTGFMSAINHADKLDELSESLGINIEDLSAWGDAAKMAGGSAEGFISSVDNVSKAMAQMDAVGKSRAAPFFKQLGISMLDAKGKIRPVMELLPELADAFERISEQESRAIGQKLGLDQGTVMLLQKGRVAVEDLVKRQKELGVVTAEDGKLAAEFKDQLDDTNHVFRSLYLSLGTSVLPVLKTLLKMLESLVGWLRKNGKLTEGFFIAISAALVGYSVSALRAATATGILSKALKLLAANKIVIVVLAIAAAFAVLYDDISAYLSGGGSMIGDFINSLKQSAEWWGTLWDVISARTEMAIADLKSFFTDLGTFVTDLWEGIKDTILSAIDAIGEGIDTALGWVGLGGGGKKSAAPYTAVKNYTPQEVDQAIGLAQKYMGQASYAPINYQASGSMGGGGKNVANSVTIGKVEVNTQATDADGIAASIGGSLGKEMRQTVSNFDDGVLY